MISIGLSVIAALADMWRGQGQWAKDKLPNKRIGLLILGLCYVAVIGWDWWAIPYLVWLNIAGVALGTGDPMGKAVHDHATLKEFLGDAYLDNMEKWQVTDNGWWSQAQLGFMWHLPCIAMYSLDPLWVLVPLINAITFPLSGVLARKLIETSDRWKFMEGVRSGLAVLTIYNVSIF